jgi:hypothetical protein
MYLSPIGEMAHRFWFEIPEHAHGVELSAFQVMPNHVHGILILRGWSGDGGAAAKSGTNSDSNPKRGPDVGHDCNPAAAETRHALSLRETKRETKRAQTTSPTLNHCKYQYPRPVFKIREKIPFHP